MTTHECPICFDIINSTNQTITECGHVFHTNCLMKNVMHNGFGCPYCRTRMCEDEHLADDQDDEENEEDSDYSEHDESIETEDEEEIRDWLVQERIQRTEERAFANLRQLFGEVDEQFPPQQDNNEDDDSDSDFDTVDDDDHSDSDSDSDSLADERMDSGRERPTTDYITEKLMQRGINMGHLVKLMLAGEYPLYDDIMSRRNYRRDTRNLHDQVRDIINNYDPQEEYDNDSEEQENQENQQETRPIIALD